MIYLGSRAMNKFIALLFKVDSIFLLVHILYSPESCRPLPQKLRFTYTTGKNSLIYTSSPVLMTVNIQQTHPLMYPLATVMCRSRMVSDARVSLDCVVQPVLNGTEMQYQNSDSTADEDTAVQCAVR